MIAAFLGATDEQIILFTFILSRVTGMLVISPLLTRRRMGAVIRMLISMFISLLMMMTLYEYYNTPDALFTTRSFANRETSWIFLSVTSLKELLVGYLLGFCFTLIFESVMLAGSVIDAATGFSTPQSYDPLTNPGYSFFTPALVLTSLMLALSLDLHHLFIRVLTDSFLIIPFGDYRMPPEMLERVMVGTGELFKYGLKIATVPFITLGLGTIGVGFVARIVPEFNPLLMGLPMRIIIALYSMMLAIGHIPPIIRHGFIHFEDLSRTLADLLGGR